MPDRQGVYSDTPEIMTRAAEACMKDGLVNIIGGCCGSTPAHIAAIAKAAKNYKPRPIPDQHEKTILSGTLVLEIENEAIANSLNPALIPWQSALDNGDYEEAVEIARDHREKLKILPLSPDHALEPLGAVKNFVFLASAFSDLAELPILIESSHWDVIEAGLKCLHGRGAVRYSVSPGISQLSEEYRKKIDLIRAYGAVPIN
jgi:5-methyltetrahydrofolate--homocysteine methyltransferase